MDLGKLWLIAVKDMRGIRDNIQVWLPMILVPLVFSVVLPLGLILLVRHSGLGAMDQGDALQQMVAELPEGPLRTRLAGFAQPEQQVVFFVFNYLLAPLFLLIPLMIASVVAAHSYASEKEAQTLESLLYAPLDSYTLYGGKLTAALVPALGVTLFCAVLYGLCVNVAAYPLFGQLIVPQWNFLVLLVFVVPALSLLAVLVNVWISARVRGFQEAYQLGALVVLPVIGLFAGQAAGVLLFSPLVLFVLGFVVWVVDGVLIYLAAGNLDRNT